MQFTRTEIARVVVGKLQGTDQSIDGVSIDSRSISRGALFVPIRADRDGHEFIDAAIAKGAGAFFTETASSNDGAILVDNCQVALAKLGNYARKRMTGPVIGVTGSSGKTSTKDLCAPILRLVAPAAASEKSLNNELGVPLTLVNAPADANWGVIEMGARGIGHIAYLCHIAEPTIGVITNIGTAHRELFKTDEMTAQAKGELLRSLTASGTAVLNLDDVQFSNLKSMTIANVVSFSAVGAAEADVVAEQIELSDDLRAAFHLKTPWGSARVELGVRGQHQVANALAAAAATLSAGVSIEHVVAGLKDPQRSPWRMELTTLATGALLLNDAYNANPSSMRAALESFAALPRTRKIAVLGTMAELGDDAAAMHREVAAYARSLGIHEVVAVNEPRYLENIVADVAAAEQMLLSLGAAGANDAVMVKGSRMAGLEKLAAALIERFGVEGAVA
jgi:UDP-N-acetylmuramoyl-tripeptide--D-alanyl-D-alanine ligase